MVFAGAPNVIHVSTNGNDINSGSSWSAAVRSLGGALGKVSGHALILIAPGEFSGDFARATIASGDSHLRIRGSGSSTVLTSSSASGEPIIKIEASFIEIEDLAIRHSNFVGNGEAIKVDASCESLAIRRCLLDGKKTLDLAKCKGVHIQECSVTGALQALRVGNLINTDPSMFQCIAENSRFFVSLSTDANAQAVDVDGGYLVMENCTVGVEQSIASPTLVFVKGVNVARGGAVVATTCQVSVVKGTGSTGFATHTGIDASDTSSRLKLTACSVYANGGWNTEAVKGLSSSSRVDADATMLSP